MSNAQNRSQDQAYSMVTQPLQPHRSSEEKKETLVAVRSRTSSSSSISPSLKTPRTARFAEATSVNSPIGPTAAGRNPFAGPPIMTNHYTPQPQPSDVGFGYLSTADKHTSVEVPLTPASPLKSALRAPGTPARFADLKSPTFKEEQQLDEHEAKTEKQNAKDLKVKTRVRMAKAVLRSVNFGCSLIVLAMIGTTLSIFNATRALAPRSGMPAWAPNQRTWPQILLLSIACLSLAFSLFFFYAYWKGGHKRAQKATVYYTVFALGFFVFSTVMWIVGAAVLHSSKAHGNNQDMWGWSCNDNKRRAVYQDDVNYTLACRLQNWALVCAIIEIVVEVITIGIYGVVFYRLYSKRKLHKSMDLRDRARSDLYLAQLRSQSAPNTPGFAKTPMSPSFPSHLQHDPVNAAEKGEYYNESTQFASKRQSFSQPKPFALQSPPIKVQSATPRLSQEGFEQAPKVQDHVPAAPGEQTYDAVPIPGAYASPIASPSFQPQSMHFGQPGQAYTAEGRVESPPASPRLPRSSFR